MIKPIVDLSLRLADLVEAEGRLAKAHAVRFLTATLIFGVAALLVGVAILIVGAAALLGLIASGLSWPVSLLIIAVGLLAAAAGAAIGGHNVLTRTSTASGDRRSAARPARPIAVPAPGTPDAPDASVRPLPSRSDVNPAQGHAA